MSQPSLTITLPDFVVATGVSSGLGEECAWRAHEFPDPLIAGEKPLGNDFRAGIFDGGKRHANR